jgi:citrate lyase subunit beta/citryl-CoA lyase
VPADRPDRVEKAIASRAHAVIVDLEDAVAPAAKGDARDNVRSLLAAPRDRVVYLRVNALGTPWAGDDFAAAAELDGIAGIELPKTQGARDAQEAVARVGGKPVRCLVESARAVEHAYAIASVDGIAGVALGELDLAAETGASGPGLDWARARVVNASVAAGLGRPPQGVYPNVADPDGLRTSCLHGRALGFLGRAAIHPAQLETIEAAFLPAAAEAESARALLVGAEARSEGAYALDDGSLVDAAVVRAARAVVDVADAYGTEG